MHVLGMEGWRFVFLSVALVSVTIGIATFFLSHDPRFDDDAEVTHSALVHPQGRQKLTPTYKTSMHTPVAPIRQVYMVWSRAREAAVHRTPHQFPEACLGEGPGWWWC
jgi:hypothetical protein